MTVNEIRAKIQEAKNPDWFNTIVFRFYNSKNGFDLSLKGITALHEYISQQIEGWENKEKPLPPNLESHKTRINHLKSLLNSFVQSNILLDSNALYSQWNNQITNNHNGEYIPYNLPEVDFLNTLNKTYPKYYNSAYEFLLGTQEVNTQTTTRNNLTGTLMAYEFLTKESSVILTRKEIEGQSLLASRRDFEKYISTSEEQINDLFKKVKEKKESDIQLTDKLREEKNELFEKWHNDSKLEFENFKNTSVTDISDLKKTYNELLRLQEPAEYWNKRAIQLKKEGNKFLTVFIVLVGVGVLFLYFLLWQTPEGMLKSFFNEDKSLALRWSIVFITFISLIFIAVRLVSKAMFSAFHLARDAEERQQLTYVYLSLRKDAAVDDKDKQLIMQSLFSRADTGLLKEDSSPTMPGGLDKIIRS
ncbi:MAG: hypothetical protein JWO32_1428 [Bacteroidetes bacterium]|nr:hypothetical protein [Bacteroidota bacterium]